MFSVLFRFIAPFVKQTSYTNIVFFTVQVIELYPIPLFYAPSENNSDDAEAILLDQPILSMEYSFLT